MAEFLAAHRVEIVASLPYYRASQTDAQRGEGVFEKSIEALRLLNELGYGRPDSGLALNLVCNPVGAFLPPKQEAIEAQFRKELRARHGVEFNHLYTITNMPISRFLEFLLESGNYEQYMERLANAFNPAAAAGVMCRYTISVSWDGTLYDCDFNQMLDLPVDHGRQPISATLIRFNSIGVRSRRATIATAVRLEPVRLAADPSPPKGYDGHLPARLRTRVRSCLCQWNQRRLKSDRDLGRQRGHRLSVGYRLGNCLDRDRRRGRGLRGKRDDQDLQPWPCPDRHDHRTDCYLGRLDRSNGMDPLRLDSPVSLSQRLMPSPGPLSAQAWSPLPERG